MTSCLPQQLCQPGVLTEWVAEDRASHADTKDGDQVLPDSSRGERTKSRAAHMDHLWRCREPGKAAEDQELMRL